jgi:UV DNA damage endonuclease
MFNQSIRRVGFACKYVQADRTMPKKLIEAEERTYNGRSTTKAWLNRQPAQVAEERMHDIVNDNIASFAKLIEYVGALDPSLRMLRLGSDVLPMFTEPTWGKFYTPEVITDIERKFAVIGERARELDVKLSMHPGQFTVLASDNDDIVTKSIEEFEYHVFVARSMGYGKEFQDFKINVHISGRRGPAGIKAALERLSPEARNTITIENDENKWGIDDSLELEKDCALVLDVHHHFCHTGGEYIQRTDDRFKRVIDSWRGIRPTIHYSYSREEYVGDVPKNELPNWNKLLEQGYKKSKLRAHSDWYPNDAANEWVLTFLEDADIMCEAKMKNLAAHQLFEFWKGKKDSMTTILKGEADSTTDT